MSTDPVSITRSPSSSTHSNPLLESIQSSVQQQGKRIGELTEEIQGCRDDIAETRSLIGDLALAHTSRDALIDELVQHSKRHGMMLEAISRKLGITVG